MSIDLPVAGIMPEIAPENPPGRRAPALKTYYGKPAIRPSLFGWKIGMGFYAIGVGAAAQIIAEVFNLLDREDSRDIVRAGRYMGLAGSIIGPLLYIADLHTPRRWYNMLRILRTTSLMSIGAWSLTAFGAFSGVAAIGQLMEDSGHVPLGKWIGRIAGFPAAITAALASIYKGTEMEETNIPLWASAYPLLSPLLSSSDSKSAASILSAVNILARRMRNRRGGKTHEQGTEEVMASSMDKLAVMSAVLELVLIVEMGRRLKYRLGKAPVREHLLLSPYGGLLGLSIAGPVILKAVQEALPGGRDLKPWALVGNLIGGFLLPSVLILAGNRTGLRPEDYFSYTRPGERNPAEPAQPSEAFRRPDREGVNPRAGFFLIGAAALYYALTRKRRGHES